MLEIKQKSPLHVYKMMTNMSVHQDINSSDPVQTLMSEYTTRLYAIHEQIK